MSYTFPPSSSVALPLVLGAVSWALTSRAAVAVPDPHGPNHGRPPGDKSSSNRGKGEVGKRKPTWMTMHDPCLTKR